MGATSDSDIDVALLLEVSMEDAVVNIDISFGRANRYWVVAYYNCSVIIAIIRKPWINFMKKILIAKKLHHFRKCRENGFKMVLSNDKK